MGYMLILQYIFIINNDCKLSQCIIIINQCVCVCLCMWVRECVRERELNSEKCYHRTVTRKLILLIKQ